MKNGRKDDRRRHRRLFGACRQQDRFRTYADQLCGGPEAVFGVSGGAVPIGRRPCGPCGPARLPPGTVRVGLCPDDDIPQALLPARPLLLSEGARRPGQGPGPCPARPLGPSGAAEGPLGGGREPDARDGLGERVPRPGHGRHGAALWVRTSGVGAHGAQVGGRGPSGALDRRPGQGGQGKARALRRLCAEGARAAWGAA